jgi:hypothetical protein
MKGFAAMTLPTGVRHVAIHYSADDEKNAGWIKETKMGMATDGKGERDWDREMELKEDIYDGEPVYGDYIDVVHCPPQFHAKPIPILRNCQYVAGWDCGATLHPACGLLQITPMGQIHELLEVTPPVPEPMETFAPRVMMALTKILPGNWDDVEHVGDATVIQRSGVDGRTAQQEAKRHGFNIKPVTNVWSVRYSAVTWALVDRIDDKTPRFFMCGHHCPVTHEGFKGRYRWDEGPNNTAVGAGRVFRMPKKDGYSHPHDALQSAMIRARQIVTLRA